MHLKAAFAALSIVFLTGASGAEHPTTGGEHPTAGGEHPSTTTAAEHAKVRALVFHADWCPKCKVLAPNLSAVKPEFEQSIEFVRLDLTNADTKKTAAAKAKELGLTKLYKANEKKTGLVLLVDRESGKPLQEVTSTMDADAIRTTMKAALAGTAASEHPKSEHSKSEHPSSEHPK